MSEKLSEDDYLIVKEDDYAVRYYITPGKLHRNYGPAIEWKDGSESWYKNGKLHRKDGPAYIKVINNVKYAEFYYRNGKLHRKDGPAIIFESGITYYYENGNIIK